MCFVSKYAYFIFYDQPKDGESRGCYGYVRVSSWQRGTAAFSVVKTVPLTLMAWAESDKIFTLLC